MSIDSSPETNGLVECKGYASDLCFYLNGQLVRLTDVDPTQLLIDYLRSDEVGLTAAKKGCGQGGCGACTVMLSARDPVDGTVKHRAINSCMHPVAALDGTMVTTNEGTGDTRNQVNPAQFAIAEHNGSQCGFCSNGFVMNLYSYLAQNPGKEVSARELEALVDGNICRCTGYRPILSAFKELGFKNACKSLPSTDMTCEIAHGDRPRSSDLPIEVDCQHVNRKFRALCYRNGHYRWFRPTSLDALRRLISDITKHGSLENVRLVVGNTSIGVYDRYTEDPQTFIDIACIPDLYGMEPTAKTDKTPKGWRIGAATTYSDLIEYLEMVSGADRFAEERPANTHISELLYMAQRTAGTLVRNAASLGGNTMMVVKHIHKGEPFPSDLFTVLCAIRAEIEVFKPDDDKPVRMPLHVFALDYHKEQALQNAVLVAYHIPEQPPHTIVRAYKTALRKVNSHSIVNAGFSVTFEGDLVSAASLVIGGVGPVAFHAENLEEYLAGTKQQPGRKWTEETLAGGLRALNDDFDGICKTYKDRLNELVKDGATEKYKRQLCLSYFYKFFCVVAQQVSPALVPPSLEDEFDRRPRQASKGTQKYTSYPVEYPVNKPFIKLSSFLQTTGEARYTHDIQMTPRGLHAAYIVSRKAKAAFKFHPPHRQDEHGRSELTRFVQDKYPAVECIIAADDICSSRNMQGTNREDPLFAKDEISFWGQCLGMVLAKDERSAYMAAHFVQENCITYSETPPVILTIAEAVKNDQMFHDVGSYPSHIQQLTRKGTDLSWSGIQPPDKQPSYVATSARVPDADGKKVDCRVITGKQAVGGQIHFYMETQSCYAEPTESGGLIVRPSSQSPDAVHKTVADVTGLPLHQIDVQITRLGGSYGGKTTRSPLIAASVAFAAQRMNRPVKLVLERAHDTAWSGKRHPFEADYSIAICDDSDDEADRGKIMGLDTYFRSDGGYSHDCSFVVMDCAQLRSDSAYMVPNYHTRGDVFRTNKASNTAYRSMGLVQANIIQEDAIAAAAHHIGMDATDVRGKNLYQQNQQTPSGQTLKYVYLNQVWKRILKNSNYVKRCREVETFNKTYRWKKRGITAIPLKYGSGYNLASLEHAGALIEVFAADGTVLVRHGGVEMGQGIMTKIEQIAAYSLGIDMHLISMSNTDTNVIPQPTGTGASTGTQYNGRAVQKAASRLEQRLIKYCHEKCKSQSIDDKTRNHLDEYLNARDRDCDKQKVAATTWATVVKTANSDRLNLSSQVRVKQPGGTGRVSGISFSDECHAYEVDEFVGYTYSAACSEVEIDVLTGVVTVLRSDVVYDMGKSLNPAIDIGQVEGAFVQGIGYVLTEELVYEPDGRLYTVNTWEYKPPAYTTIPLEFNVELFHLKKDAGSFENPNDLLSSKEVGEPPLVLASTVYFAVKNAIMAAREHVGKRDWIYLPAPLTPQKVRDACAVTIDDLKILR